MNRFRVGAALGAAALLMALAGCSGAPSTSADLSDSPLNKILSSLYGGDLSEEEQIERSERMNLEREEHIAECMSEEGFDYLPAVYDGSMMVSSANEWKPDDREWVAQYGYGMVNWPGRDEQVDPGQEWVDPNQEYVESLSETEREAYYEALHGPPVSEEQLGDDGSYEWNWETAGCYGWAEHEMSGDDPMQSDAHKPLMDAISDFYNTMQTSPEFAEIDAEWADCMADAGHSGFASQSEAQNSMNEELNAYYENQTEWIEDDPALDEIAEREVTLALADLECRQKVDYTKQRTAIQFELEEKFIADHKAELDALVADAEQGR